MAKPEEDELLILNSIIYTESFADLKTDSSKKPLSVLEWAERFDINSIDDANKPAEMSKTEFENVIKTIKNNPDVYGEMKIRDVDNTQYANESGSQRVTNATITYGKDTIVVYKGTAGDMEWRDNGEGSYSNITDTAQQQKALEYYDKMVDRFAADGGDIYVTGHSKGGNKAQYVGVLRGDQIKWVVSFDGQGFNQAFIMKYQDLIDAYSGKITNISNEYDFVNILLNPIAGDRRYITSTTTWGLFSSSGLGDLPMHKFGGWHSPYSMYKEEGGLLSLNEEVDQSALMSTLQGLFLHYQKYMNEEDWRFMCYSIMSVMQNGEIAYGTDYSEMPEGFVDRLIALTKGYTEKNKGIDAVDVFTFLDNFFKLNLIVSIGGALVYDLASSESYSYITRDFTGEAKETLLKLVEEVEDEPFWDVTKWDAFYRVEQLFGGVDFPGNSSELNNYYQKVIDINGTTADEINRIFDAVYGKENQFSTQMQTIKKQVTEISDALKKLADSFA